MSTQVQATAKSPVAALVDKMLEGDKGAASRLMTIVENRRAGYSEALRLVAPHTGRAYLIGITGPPGAGKSTLTNALIKHFRSQGKTVGVIAVDPTSAISGGALLGDRIRMLEFYQDRGVFVRSMASRGQLGGLSAATSDVARIMDAYGLDIVIIETVGVGQGEVAIAGLADTTLLLEIPGMGDDVQALKAGVLEVADILVVNKADREGADRVANQIKTAMRLLPGASDAWIPPIVKTVAVEGKGVEELAAAIESHREYLEAQGRFKKARRERMMEEVLERARDILIGRLTVSLQKNGELDNLLDRLMSGEIDPAAAARGIVAEIDK